jgi:hypothetical protein
MAKGPTTVEKALEQLLGVLREPDPSPSTTPVLTGAVPDELRTKECRALSLYAPEKLAFERARRVVFDDPRFEYLGERAIQDAVWRFVCEFQLRRTKGLIRQFVDRYVREPMERTCFFPVQLLTVENPLELHGVRLEPRPSDTSEETVPGCIAAVPCRGTDYGQMSKRARPLAEHALRVLRATLREYRFMPDEQLRFRLGYSV